MNNTTLILLIVAVVLIIVAVVAVVLMMPAATTWSSSYTEPVVQDDKSASELLCVTYSCSTDSDCIQPCGEGAYCSEGNCMPASDNEPAQIGQPSQGNPFSSCVGFPSGTTIGQPFDLGQGTYLTPKGEVERSGNTVCKLDVSGGPVDACGGFEIYIDLDTMLSEGPQAVDYWQQYTECDSGVPSSYCENECNTMLSIWFGSSTSEVV